MSEEELDVLITLDDPGEDALEEDTFHQADNTPGQSHQPHRQGCDATTIQK
jgi:hypothetical protein